MSKLTARAWLAALLLMLTGGIASAQTVERIDLLDYGLYRATRTGDNAAPGTATGTLHVVGDVTFYEKTTRVPARLGTRFGIRFVVVGSPAGQKVTLLQGWKLPPAGLRNPKTGVLYFEEGSPTVKTIGEPTMRGYSFDEPWELVTGDWTMELWSGNRKLLSKTFTVYAP